MKYFGFLARYVILPLVIIRALIWWLRQRGQTMPEPLSAWNEENTLALHSTIALTYTTIWDNYLVASEVWGYDPKRVTGITIGWVPIEEYSFFVLQPLMVGSWLQLAARFIPVDNSPYTRRMEGRLAATGVLGVIWAVSTIDLFRGSKRRKYLDLILAWALPPVMLQVAFGGDILWRHRRLVAAGLLPASAYLGWADSQAIGEGIWHISPKQTVGIDVIPKLPLEEFLFFFMTNVLLIFGITLAQAKESEDRLPEALRVRYLEWKQKLLNGR
jgi:lycopene cyclase domain-containing protein